MAEEIALKDLSRDNDDDDEDDEDDYAWDEENYKNPKASTSTSYFTNPAYDGEDEEQENSPNEKTSLLGNKQKEFEGAEYEIKIVRPESKVKQFVSFFQRIGDGIKLPAVKGPSGATYVYKSNEDDFRRYDIKKGKLMEKLKPGKLKDALGPTRGEIVERINLEIANKKEKQNERLERKKVLDNKPNKTTEEEVEIENLNAEVIENDEDIANDVAERERIQETMSLRERIKYIFKKYGFTVFAILSAAGLVIGVIISNLSKGLTTLGKGLGNGLKNYR